METLIFNLFFILKIAQERDAYKNCHISIADSYSMDSNLSGKHRFIIAVYSWDQITRELELPATLAMVAIIVV